MPDGKVNNSSCVVEKKPEVVAEPVETPAVQEVKPVEPVKPVKHKAKRK
jgi:hypothetical protein